MATLNTNGTLVLLLVSDTGPVGPGPQRPQAPLGAAPGIGAAQGQPRPGAVSKVTRPLPVAGFFGRA
jgi:hypothetical protein